jgi:hypothetical protein
MSHAQIQTGQFRGQNLRGESRDKDEDVRNARKKERKWTYLHSEYWKEVRWSLPMKALKYEQLRRGFLTELFSSSFLAILSQVVE